MEIVIIFVMGMAVDFIRQILYKLCKKNNVKLKNSQCKKLKEGLN